MISKSKTVTHTRVTNIEVYRFFLVYSLLWSISVTKLEAQLRGSEAGWSQKFGQNPHEFKRIVQFLGLVLWKCPKPPSRGGRNNVLCIRLSPFSRLISVSPDETKSFTKNRKMITDWKKVVAKSIQNTLLWIVMAYNLESWSEHVVASPPIYPHILVKIGL